MTADEPALLSTCLISFLNHLVSPLDLHSLMAVMITLTVLSSVALTGQNDGGDVWR